MRDVAARWQCAEATYRVYSDAVRATSPVPFAALPSVEQQAWFTVVETVLQAYLCLEEVRQAWAPLSKHPRKDR